MRTWSALLPLPICLLSLGLTVMTGTSVAAVILTGAHAGDGLSGTGSPPPASLNFAYSAAFPQFNPDLGTLQSVSIRSTSVLVANSIFGNLSESTVYFGVTASSMAYLTPHSGVFVPSAAVSGGYQLEPRENFALDLYDSNANYSLITRDNSAYFDNFIGQGSILLEGLANFSSGYSSVGLAGQWYYSSSIHLEVEYQYEVPEPATFAPVMLGLGWLGWRGRERLCGRKGR